MSSTNVCTFSKDEAQSIADEFVNKIGMADVTLNKAQDLYWYYYGADGNTDSVEVDGYVFPIQDRSIISRQHLPKYGMLIILCRMMPL